MRLSLLAVVLGSALAGCDLDGNFLFADPSELVPGVLHLGEIEPAVIDGPEDVRDAAVYGEIGATGTSERGGVTFSFRGTGGSVCVWVDPEMVFWNQSVHATDAVDKWSWPDNVYDDGDIDLTAGYAVYYNGSPGERMGSFDVLYEDALGNKIPVELNECTITNQYGETGAHSGRAAPESCTMRGTQPGVRYMVALDAFSTPLNDNRMGYGLIVTEGACSTLLSRAGALSEECVLPGEDIMVGDHDYREDPVLSYGFDESISEPGAVAFEQLFCQAAAGSSTAMKEYCQDEAARVQEAGQRCEVDVRCFCGDITDTPSGGTQ